MLAFCNRRQKKSPRDCADQLTKIIIKNMFFLNDGERKSQFPENKANTIGIRIQKKKKLNSYTSCTAVNNFHSLIKNYARPTNACMQNANVCDLHLHTLYDNIQYAYYTIFYLSVCSTPL